MGRCRKAVEVAEDYKLCTEVAKAPRELKELKDHCHQQLPERLAHLAVCQTAVVQKVLSDCWHRGLPLNRLRQSRDQVQGD